MIYRIVYRSLYDVTVDQRVYETRSRAEFNAYLKKLKKYDGSYRILDIEKISEAKSKK